MASILKATSSVGARALKPSSRGAKELRNKLESFNKEHADKGTEDVSLTMKKAREWEDKGKEKTPNSSTRRES